MVLKFFPRFQLSTAVAMNKGETSGFINIQRKQQKEKKEPTT